MTIFAFQNCKINNVYYPGGRGQQFDRALDFESEGADGAVHETFHGIRQAKPSAEIMHTALKSLLVAFTGSTDLPLLALDGTNGLVLFGAKAADGAPGYASGTVHHSRVGLNGVVWISAVRWSSGGVAEVVLKVMYKTTNGANDPVTYATVALPAQQLATEFFVESQLIVNGVTLDTLFSAEVLFDPKFEFDYTGGLPYPTFISGGGTRGRCSHRLNLDMADPTVLEGTGACSIQFTGLAQAGVLGSPTATFTFNNPWVREESWGGTHVQPQGRRMVVRPRYDGTTKPVTWGTT